MEIRSFVVSMAATNCYFVINEKTKEMLCIDPGDRGKGLAQIARREGFRPAAVLLTHGHFDHAGGAEDFAREFDIPIYIHEEEKETLSDPQMNVSWMIGKSAVYHADRFLADEEELDLAGFHFRVLLTPGHTPGGCCYYFPYEKTLFSGDTLFNRSVGRTDFKGGSMAAIVNSIRTKLMTLPEETLVYPGHGEMTSIEEERMYNPYL